MKNLYLFFMLLIVGTCFAEPLPTGIFSEGEYSIFVPDTADSNFIFPVIIGFSPGGKGMDVINTWKSAAQAYQCIIVASNVVRNGMDIRKQLIKIKADILEQLAIKYPLNPDRVLALGVSGGGMAAHMFSFFHPDFVKGVISNVGYIHETCLKNPKNYPEHRICAFLASPTDFNYKIMQEDHKFLSKKKWTCKWIEFEGGHRTAPESARFDALEFVLTQMK